MAEKPSLEAPEGAHENQFEQNEREVSPEVVRAVENSLFGSIIGDLETGTTTKIELLLVAAGLKPATDLRLVVKDENGMTGAKFEITEDEIRKNIELLDKLGLCRNQGERKIEKSSWKEGAKKRFTESEEIEILVARTPEDLRQLADVWGSGKDHEIGCALGFPKTAVDAYPNWERLLDEEKVYNELTPEEKELLTFKSFRLSADNWREELEQIKPWANFIKRVSPKLYGKMMESRKR